MFLESVLSELKTIRQQSEEQQRMTDDLLQRVTPAAPEERIETDAYPMTNHDRPEQPAGLQYVVVIFVVTSTCC